VCDGGAGALETGFGLGVPYPPYERGRKGWSMRGKIRRGEMKGGIAANALSRSLCRKTASVSERRALL
jgi:hypothetical protein